MTHFNPIAILAFGIIIGLSISLIFDFIAHRRLDSEVEQRALEHGIERHPGESTKSLAQRLREHEIFCEADALVELMEEDRLQERLKVASPASVLLECAWRTGNVGRA